MADRTRSDDQFLDLPEDDALAGEHLDNQVQKAQEQLLSLKRQQEAIKLGSDDERYLKQARVRLKSYEDGKRPNK